MAMPPRSSKGRVGSQRWLVVPFVLTLAVLLVDASMHARSTKPEATLNSQAWVDKVLPEIARSSAQGSEIAQVSSGIVATGGSSAIADELSKIAGGTVATYKAVAADAAPPEVASAAGLLEACLSAREQGAAQMATAVQHLLGGDGPSAATSQMMSAVSDFDVSNNAYQLFTSELPNLGVTMPASVWSGTGDSYQPQGLTAFATRLLSGVTQSQPHKLHIDAITTDPPALSVQGNVQVLSPANTVEVTAVVADLGLSAEQGVKVTATISPALGAASQHVTVSVNLSPGQANAVHLMGLRLQQSTPTTLTIGALEPSSEPGSAYETVTVEVPGQNFGETTTSTTTTSPGQPTTSTTSSTTTT
jgi:hypothetical protein